MTNTGEIFFGPDAVHNEAYVFQREWLLTNGIGGYSSASVAGGNTRRYHGLLVAALTPPLGRAVLLSKIEETIETVSEAGESSPTYSLASNHYPGVTYPQGYLLLQSWTNEPIPTWTWSPSPGVVIRKRIWMANGHNAVYIAYDLLEAPSGCSARLHLVPLMAWKDYHSEMRSCNEVPHFDWYSTDTVVAREPNAPRGTLRVFLPQILNQPARPEAPVLSLVVTDLNGAPKEGAEFAGQPYWNYRFVHDRDAERGQDCIEDLFAPGMLTMKLAPGETVVVTASVEVRDSVSLPVPQPQEALDGHMQHTEQLTAALAPGDEFARKLALAADQFLVAAPGGRSTVIAGYHWFADWGRDTMIALPGLTLYTGRQAMARDILASFSRYVDQGMLPNRFPDAGSTPEYNTVDATLWYFVAIYRYFVATGDLDTVRSVFWPVLEEIIQCHQNGTRYGIRVDSDSLLYAGEAGVQLTWMDAKIGDWVVTPRIGKPVEINALWYNALRVMEAFAGQLGDKAAEERYGRMAATHSRIFEARYLRPDGNGLYDVLDTPPVKAPDDSIRPNQVFAISLPFPVLDTKAEAARTVVNTVLKHLWTPVGLRTLSPQDRSYRSAYQGSMRDRDSAYHQGTVWPWLAGPFAEAHFKVFGDRDSAIGLLKELEPHLTDCGVGTLCEVYDGGNDALSEPQKGGGCISQAWSVAETLRVWQDLNKIRSVS